MLWMIAPYQCGGKRALGGQPDQDGQEHGQQTQRETRRALTQLGKPLCDRQPGRQHGHQRKDGQSVVGAQRKGRRRAYAHTCRRKKQLFADFFLPKDAERHIQRQQRRQIGVFLRQVAAVHERARHRQIDELRPNRRAGKRSGQRADNRQAGEQRDDLLQKHGGQVIAAADPLRQPLKRKEQGAFVVKHIDIRRPAFGQRRAHRQVHGVVAADGRAERRVVVGEKKHVARRHQQRQQQVQRKRLFFCAVHGYASASPSRSRTTRITPLSSLPGAM